MDQERPQDATECIDTQNSVKNPQFKVIKDILVRMIYIIINPIVWSILQK